MDLIYTDENRIDKGVLKGFELNLAYGEDENQLHLTIDTSGPQLANGSLVYIEGTEYGGLIGKTSVDTENRKVTYSGHTWHGLLNQKIIQPQANGNPYTVQGEANTVLQTLIDRLDLGDIFVANNSSSGVSINYQFPLYVTGYNGIWEMLESSSAKLSIEFTGDHAVLNAQPIDSYVDEKEYDSDQMNFVIEKNHRPVNHLICTGEDENKKRFKIDLYADNNGKVSTTQTLRGIDEVVAVLETSKSTTAELRAEGIEKLEEAQNQDTLEVSINPKHNLDIGDVIGAFEVNTGLEITAVVKKKIARIDHNGILTVSYEVGTATAGSSSGISGGGSSGSGGIVYTAGEGIVISGYTISAEVTPADLTSIRNVANEANATASNASSTAGGALAIANSAVQSIETISPSPLSVDRAGNSVGLSHDKSGVLAGLHGPQENYRPTFGETVINGSLLSINDSGHITASQSMNLTMPNNVATQQTAGLFSSADKTKLDNVEPGANKYELPVATSSMLGGVKPDGVTVTISSDGKLTAQLGGSASFLAAHPIGSFWWTSSSEDPNTQGGTWDKAPSMGANCWHRVG